MNKKTIKIILFIFLLFTCLLLIKLIIPNFYLMLYKNIKYILNFIELEDKITAITSLLNYLIIYLNSEMKEYQIFQSLKNIIIKEEFLLGAEGFTKPIDFVEENKPNLIINMDNLNNTNPGIRREEVGGENFKENNPSAPSGPSNKNKKVKFNSISKLRQYEDINTLEGNTDKEKEILYLENDIFTKLSDGNTASTNNPNTGISRVSSSINLENKPVLKNHSPYGTEGRGGVEEKNYIPDFNFDYTDSDNN
jgi:hypothetical protein